MEKELSMHMNMYLKMKEGETKEEAETRFIKMIEELNKDEEQVSYQIYETEEQEV